MADNLNPVKANEEVPGTTVSFPVPVAPPASGVELGSLPTSEPKPVAPAVPSFVSAASAVDTPALDNQASAAYAEATREKSSISESMQAGVESWATTDLIRAATVPTFEKGDEDVGTLIHNTPFPLNEAEVEYLRENRSKSLAEHTYRLEQVKANRERQQVMGDSLFGMVANVFDPVWIIPGLASGGLAAVANVGRVARFGIGAGLEAGAAVAINEGIALARPIDDNEKAMNVVTGALFGGASTLLFPPRRGKPPVKADPDFPGDKLNDIANDIPHQAPTDRVVNKERPDGSGYDTVPTGQSVPDTPAGARDIPPIVKETADVPVLDVYYARIPVPKGSVRTTARRAIDEALTKTNDPQLREMFQYFKDKMGPMLDKMPVYTKDGVLVRGKPRVAGYYDVGGDKLQMKKNAPEWVLAHELTHAVTANKLTFGRKNRSTTHGKITTELENLYNLAKPELEKAGGQTAYFATNLDEFVAGLFSRDQKFVDILSAIPDPGNPRRSVLGKLVDGLRRLLGMELGEMNAFFRGLQLTDELIDQPLKVVYHRPKRGPKQALMADEVVVTREDAVKATTAEADGMLAAVSKTASDFTKWAGWNYHKSMSKFSSKVADILLDNPLNPTGDTVDSWSRTIRAEFTVKQRVYEDALMEAMATRGVNLFHALVAPRKYKTVQREVEAALKAELDHRNNYFVTYGEKAPARRGVPEDIVKLADRYEDTMGFALRELKQSGVYGADDIIEQQGYYPRRWSSVSYSDALVKMGQKGFSDDVVKAAFNDAFTNALLKLNPDWDDELARRIGKSMVDRMDRKGDQLDADFRSHIGNAEIATIGDMLDALPAADRKRVLDKLAGIRDEANKATYLKSRLKLDIDQLVTFPDGSSARLRDFIEGDMSNSLEKYLDEVAGRSAFARKGLVTASDIENLKTDLIKDIRQKGGSTYEREQATKMFDNAVALLHGRPVGTDFAWGVRLAQAVTQMVGLGASGIWQITEYAKLMQVYGLRKTLKYMAKSATFGEDLRKLTPEQAGRLEHILSRNAFQDIRLRPLIEKLEDGFDIPTTSTSLQIANQAKQLIPYLNAMKYIHRHQANLVGNLIVDTLEQAARGDAKALKILGQYGVDLESPLLGHVKSDILKHGGDTTKWGDSTWDDIKNGLNRMMDDSVLRSRRGDMPAWAQTSDLGKFVFTFRSFVLSAHNKTMLGTINRDGLAGYGLLLMYQYPLSLMAVKMNNIKRGDDMDDEELLSTAVAQMGGIGMLSEIYGAVTGDKQQFGAPGLIGIDRGYKVMNAVGTGDAGNIGAALLGAIPLLPILPFTNGLQETLKD